MVEYTPYYCEENAWHRCRRHRAEGLDVRVTIISNERRRCLLFNQSAAGAPGESLLWDYHVIVASRTPGAPFQIWDPDSHAPLPSAVLTYAEATFAPERDVPARYRPRFRVLEGDRYLRTLSSDRSHMRRADGSFLQPEPPWPEIRNGPPNLLQLFDVRLAPTEWIDLPAWLALHEGDAPGSAR